MRFHHIAIFVSDMDESLKVYRDLLGFRVIQDEIIPGTRGFFKQEDLDNIMGVENAQSRQVILLSDENAMIELQQPSNPSIKSVPKEHLRYGHVGISEIALKVTDIESWMERVSDAGYQLQTDYVWEAGGLVKSFIFYDPDGCMVQMVEPIRK